MSETTGKTVVDMSPEAFSSTLHAMQCQAISDGGVENYRALVELERRAGQGQFLHEPGRALDRAVAAIYGHAKNYDANEVICADDYPFAEKFERDLSLYDLQPHVRDEQGFTLMHYLARDDRTADAGGALSDIFAQLVGDNCDHYFSQVAKCSSEKFRQDFWDRNNRAGRSAIAEELTHLRNPDLSDSFLYQGDDWNWYEDAIRNAGPDTPDADGFTLFERVCGRCLQRGIFEASRAAAFRPAAHSLARVAALWSEFGKSTGPAFLEDLHGMGLSFHSEYDGLNVAGHLAQSFVNQCRAAADEEEVPETAFTLLQSVAWLIQKHPDCVKPLNERPLADCIKDGLAFVASRPCEMEEDVLRAFFVVENHFQSELAETVIPDQQDDSAGVVPRL